MLLEIRRRQNQTPRQTIYLDSATDRPTDRLPARQQQQFRGKLSRIDMRSTAFRQRYSLDNDNNVEWKPPKALASDTQEVISLTNS